MKSSKKPAKKSHMLAPASTSTPQRFSSGELRALFVESLVKHGIDPIQGLMDMLKNEGTPADVKARINLEILKLLVPAAPKLEADSKERDIQVVVTSFKSLTQVAGDDAKPATGEYI